MAAQIKNALRDRLLEGRSGRLQALVAAVSIGAAAGVMTYRVLRGERPF